MLYFDVNLGRAKYMEAAKRHGWPSYYQVKKAKEALLYPKDICYGDARVEVSLHSLIAHSTARLLEFLCEEKDSLVHSLTDAERMSLQLWAKVGSDGQVGVISPAPLRICLLNLKRPSQYRCIFYITEY
jgi:hypothetical protein